MLDHINQRVQAFERTHGHRPNVVFINHTHYRVLREQWPELFVGDPAIRLGFRLAIVADSALAHPSVAWFPERGTQQVDTAESEPTAQVHYLRVPA